MAQRPTALGVEIGIKVRRAVIEQLVCTKAVKPKQPVGLIKPVFAQQRRLGVERGQERVLYDRHIGRVENALEAIGIIERLREI